MMSVDETTLLIVLFIARLDDFWKPMESDGRLMEDYLFIGSGGAVDRAV